MSFATSIHCMDGRIQEPVITFLRNHYRVDYIDCITEVGPCKILAENNNLSTIEHIIDRVNISVSRHKSHLIVLSGHHDCAGNPSSKSKQLEQLHKGVELLTEYFPKVPKVRLWVNEEWGVELV